MLRNWTVNLSLIVFCMLQQWCFSQPAYNDCDKALYLCPLVTENVTNYDATKTLCPGCEDDFNYCFVTRNTIWMTFETNATGGGVQVDFTNVTIENAPGQGNQVQAVMVQAIAPCDASTFTQIGNCEAAATGSFTLTATGLLPSTSYYIIVNGAQNGTSTAPARATMDVTISGTGVDRIPPGIALQIPNDTICAGESMLFSAYVGDCPDTADYNWYINGDLVAVTQLNTFETSALQQGDVLSVSTSCYAYCIINISTASTPFTVIGFPLSAGPDFTTKPGEGVILQGSTTAPVFHWTPDLWLSDPASLHPVAVPQSTTSYFLSATQDGCTFSDEMTIFVQEDLNITNTFTPNGDGYNDTWEIPSLENYPNCFVEIYDRWGQSIYQTTGYGMKKSWDGKSKGKLMEAGVYFYVIDVRDPKFNEPIRGALTLVR